MSKFRYVAIAPDRIEQRQKLGAASYLHDFLVDHQTDAGGKVNYGKPFSYAWIRAHWANAPPIRTLKWQMAKLKNLGHVRKRRAPFGGMIVTMLGSVKWSQVEAPPATQIPLFAPRVASISTRNGSNGAKGANLGQWVAPSWGNGLPQKEVRSKSEEKSTERGKPRSAVEARNRRLEREMAIRAELYVGAGPEVPRKVKISN